MRISSLLSTNFWTFLFCLFLTLCGHATFPTQTHALQQPDWSYYRNTRQLQTSMKEWATRRPDLLKAYDFAANASPGTETPPSQLVVLTDNQHTRGDLGREKLRVLYVAGEHGRELITSEVVQHFVEYLLQNSPSPLLRHSADADAHQDVERYPLSTAQLWVSALLRNVEFHIVICLSVWSRMRAEQGQICNRKNINNVDLNRNWDYLWDRDPSPHANNRHYEQYRGPSAFSEVESRAVRDLMQQLAPHLYINVHSGIREMYIGWDHRSDLIPDAPIVLPLLELLNTTYCNCPYGGAGKIGGYVVYGGSMDYAYDKLGIKYAITVEVYGGRGPVRECFAYFNPNTQDAFKETITTWRHILMLAPVHLLHREEGARLLFPLPHKIDGVPLTIDAMRRRAGATCGGGFVSPSDSSSSSSSSSVLCPPVARPPSSAKEGTAETQSTTHVQTLTHDYFSRVRNLVAEQHGGPNGPSVLLFPAALVSVFMCGFALRCRASRSRGTGVAVLQSTRQDSAGDVHTITLTGPLRGDVDKARGRHGIRTLT